MLGSSIAGASGTGGLLIIYSNFIRNNGSIQSNGKNNISSFGPPGGSTGGGSINIFYSNSIYQGNVTATGGKETGTYSDFECYGGAGGNGCITFSKINMP